MARLGSGRRLRSSLSAADCRRTLEAVVDAYGPRRYSELPHVVDSGYEWFGDGRPASVVSFTDSRDEFLLVTFVPNGVGTDIGVFPLGSGDARLQLPLPGHWKMRDASLTSMGSYPAATVALREPPIPPNYVQEIITAAGFPATARNVHAVRSLLTQQFLIKAHQFINSKQPSVANNFVAMHRNSDDHQAILHDLGRWDAGVLAYIQDLPLRIRALLLEPEIRRSSPLWGSMER